MPKKKVEEIVKTHSGPDWISRDKKTFVHKGTEHRSGWDESYKSVSRYLYGTRSTSGYSQERKLQDIYEICRNRMRNLTPGKRTSLLFSEKETTGRTDGRRIYVSTSVLNDKVRNWDEIVDIMLGITTHEVAHILYSDFDLFRKIDTFSRSVMNIIEDERIEHMIGEEYPGYAVNIEAIKRWLFEEKYSLDAAAMKESLSKMTDEEKAATQVFDAFFKFIRYPKYLDAEVVSEHEITIDEIKDALTPYPMTAEAVFKATKKVVEILGRKMEEAVEEMMKEKEEEEEKKAKEEEEKTGKPVIRKIRITDDARAEAVKEAMSKAKSKIGSEMEYLESDNKDGEGKAPSKPIEKAEGVETTDYRTERVEDKEWRAMFRKGKPSRERYEKLLHEVEGDSRRLANALYTRTFNESKIMKGMRTGTLEDNRIVEAAHGVKTVYFTKTEKLDRKVNVTLLIDESGSMGPVGYEKADDAARAAIMIEKAFKIFPSGQLFIYGFTGDTGGDYNQIIRYKEPGLDIDYGLGDVRGRSQNRDGHCIRAVARRVRQFTNEPMIYFIISDGQPAAGDYIGSRGMNDTRSAVEEVTKMKFFPIQIGIGGEISVEEQKAMFKEFVNYKTSKQMVEDIRRLLLRKAHKYMGV